MADERLAELLVKQMREAGFAALRELVEEIVRDSKADTPPTNMGEHRNPDPERPPLRESYHVRWFGTFVSISVEAPHAVKQHEALHFKHPRGGRAKFLERHVAAANNRYQGKLAASVRTHLTGTGRVRVRAGSGLRD